MQPINQTPAWQALEQHYRDSAHLQMRERFAADPQRFAAMHETLDGLLFDYSKNRISEHTLELLCRLADTARVAEQAEAMRSGALLNRSEDRAALHTALRLPAGADPVFVNGENVLPLLHRELNRALDFAEALLSGRHTGCSGERITDLVHIGIGGSELGPQTAVTALAPYRQNIRIHFAANADPEVLGRLLPQLDARRTVFSIASKSFGTPETLLNAQAARDWFLRRPGIRESDIARHFAAVSTHLEATAAFGIPPEQTFGMFDWVGGRYSVWSAIGLPVMVAVGADAFRQFLAGAHAADRHFFQTPYRHNIPVLMALLGIWYGNFHHAETHAVIPYSHLLRRLPAHLQQLDMESNGKHVRRDGTPLDYATGPIIWGEEGVNCQHAFFQLIHQGTRLIPVDFIVPVNSTVPAGHQQDFVAANAFAQAEALMRGKTTAEAAAAWSHLPPAEQAEAARHNEFAGNRPSNTLLIDAVTPYTLGMLMALYEHKVFVQGAVWGINSFDQWGVEYGKVLAKTIQAELEGTAAGSHDSSTAGLIAAYRRCKQAV